MDNKATCTSIYFACDGYFFTWS